MVPAVRGALAVQAARAVRAAMAVLAAGGWGAGRTGQDPGGRPRKRRAAAWLIGVRVIAASLSLAVLVGGGWAWAVYRNFSHNLQTVDAIGNSTKPKKDIDGKAQNILMVGDDDRDTATRLNARPSASTPTVAAPTPTR